MIKTQVLKHLSGARKGKRGASKEDVMGGATARGAMDKGRYLKVIEEKRSEEMTQSNTSSLRGSKVLFESQRGVRSVEVPRNEKISKGATYGGKKGVGSAIRRRRANSESVHIKK